VVLSLVVLIGAVFAAVVALATVLYTCDDPTSGHCENRGPFRTQLVVALLGLVPALSSVVASLLRRDSLALASFVLAVLVYVVWAFLNDAAVHS
jgi:hypothetical protein